LGQADFAIPFISFAGAIQSQQLSSENLAAHEVWKDLEIVSVKRILSESDRSHKEYAITEKPAHKAGKHRIAAQEYGTPIDFRGLRHAPLNENGVVYLFALRPGVSR